MRPRCQATSEGPDNARDGHTHRSERALTMVELLVCLGVLAIALGSILSVFITGARVATNAQRKMDAGRVARVVFELVDRGFVTSSGQHGRGADGPGKFQPEVVKSEELSSLVGGTIGRSPAYVIYSPLALVWRAELSTPPAGTYDFDDFHVLEITVSHDTNDNSAFDVTDEVVGKYYALLADRSP
jgi:type II secretory pathway pseudopilin PulG